MLLTIIRFTFPLTIGCCSGKAQYELLNIVYYIFDAQKNVIYQNLE